MQLAKEKLHHLQELVRVVQQGGGPHLPIGDLEDLTLTLSDDQVESEYGESEEEAYDEANEGSDEEEEEEEEDEDDEDDDDEDENNEEENNEEEETEADEQSDVSKSTDVNYDVSGDPNKLFFLLLYPFLAMTLSTNLVLLTVTWARIGSTRNQNSNYKSLGQKKKHETIE